MSSAKRFDRRSLFDVFRRAIRTEQREAAQPVPSAPSDFSLATFYERRGEDGADRSVFPRFSLREGLTPEPGDRDERT
jgi:hypothetical protein